jgi:hypothetical protein
VALEFRQPERLELALDRRPKSVMPVPELKPSAVVARPVLWGVMLEQALPLAVSQSAR